VKCSFEFAGVVFSDYLAGDMLLSDVTKWVEERARATGLILTLESDRSSAIDPQMPLRLFPKTEFAVVVPSVSLVFTSFSVDVNCGGSSTYSDLIETVCQQHPKLESLKHRMVFMTDERKLRLDEVVNTSRPLFVGVSGRFMDVAVSDSRVISVKMRETDVFSDFRIALPGRAKEDGVVFTDSAGGRYADGRPICSVVFPDRSAVICVRSLDLFGDGERGFAAARTDFRSNQWSSPVAGERKWRFDAVQAGGAHTLYLRLPQNATNADVLGLIGRLFTFNGSFAVDCIRGSRRLLLLSLPVLDQIAKDTNRFEIRATAIRFRFVFSLGTRHNTMEFELDATVRDLRRSFSSPFRFKQNGAPIFESDSARLADFCFSGSRSRSCQIADRAQTRRRHHIARSSRRSQSVWRAAEMRISMPPR
jgi:hypothetical protein